MYCFIADIGAACDATSPCTIQHATCDTDNLCSCRDGYISENSTSCIECEYVVLVYFVWSLHLADRALSSAHA